MGNGYIYSILDIAYESATLEAVVIEFFISIFVVFVLRRLQKREALKKLTHAINKLLIVEDDYGRTVITFCILFILQIIFISPHTLYVNDQDKITDLNSITNQVFQEKLKLVSENQSYFTNNAYLHDQWISSVALAGNYLGQINDLNLKLQKALALGSDSSPSTNSDTQSSSSLIPQQQNTNCPLFDLYLNHKYVSNGAVFPLNDRKLFFQVVNVGTATATNMSISVCLPINVTNFIFDMHWISKPVPQWIPGNHQMFDMSDTATLQLVASQPIVPDGTFNVTTFEISATLKSSATSLTKLRAEGYGFSHALDGTPDLDPYLPITILLGADNAKMQQYVLGLQF